MPGGMLGVGVGVRLGDTLLPSASASGCPLASRCGQDKARSTPQKRRRCGSAQLSTCCMALCLLLLLLANISSGEEIVYRSKCPHGEGKCTVNNTVVLGGLFPLRKSTSNHTKECTGDIQEKGIQRMMAMVYAIEEINNSSLLSGIKLAFEIRDTCEVKTYTRTQMVAFIQRTGCSRKSGNSTLESVPISGIVGASSSGQSIAAADLAEVFQIPMVSYAATSVKLGTDQYSYFFRVLPSDSFQVRAIGDILKKLDATFFNLVYSAGDYGESGAASVKEEVKKFGRPWCIANEIALPKGLNEGLGKDQAAAAFNISLDPTSTQSKATVTVAFASAGSMKRLFSEFRETNVRFPDGWTWIASDSWADPSSLEEESRHYALGMVGVIPSARSIDEFANFFSSSRKAIPPENKFLELFSNQTPSTSFTVNSKVPFVVDAVYAFAHAIRNLTNGSSTIPAHVQQHLSGIRRGALDGEGLRNALGKVNFPGRSAEQISFNDVGDLKESLYEIANAVSTTTNATNRTVRRDVGTWELDVCANSSGGVLNLSLSDIAWHRNSTPISVCSQPCWSGEGRNFTREQGFETCCWECSSCTGNTVSNSTDYGLACQQCPDSQKSNKEHDRCVAIPQTYATIHDPLKLVCCIVAAAFLMVVAWVGFKMYSTGLGKLNDLSAMKSPLLVAMLSGMAMSFFSVFLGLIKPSGSFCVFREFWLALSVGAVITPVVVRIGRGSLRHVLMQRGDQQESMTSSGEMGCDDDSCFQDSGFGDHKASVNSSPGIAALNTIEPRTQRFFAPNDTLSAGRRDSVFAPDGKDISVRRRHNLDRRMTLSSTVSKASGTALDLVVASILFFILVFMLCVSAASQNGDDLLGVYSQAGSQRIYCRYGSAVPIGAAWSALCCLTVAVITFVSKVKDIIPPTVLKYAALAVLALTVIESSVVVVVLLLFDDPGVKEGLADLVVISFAIVFLLSVVIIDVRDAGKSPSVDDVFDEGPLKRMRHDSTFKTLTPGPLSAYPVSGFDRSPKRMSEQLNAAKFTFDSPLVSRQLRHLTAASGDYVAAATAATMDDRSDSPRAHHTARKRSSTQPTLERIVSAGPSEMITDPVDGTRVFVSPPLDSNSPAGQLSCDMPVADAPQHLSPERRRLQLQLLLPPSRGRLHRADVERSPMSSDDDDEYRVEVHSDTSPSRASQSVLSLRGMAISPPETNRRPRAPCMMYVETSI